MKKIYLLIFIFLVVTGCTPQPDNFIEDNSSVEKNELVEYYKDDEMINLFINKYNELYTDEKISSDMLSVYHHHGKDHKDQVQLYLKDLEVTITGTKGINQVELFIDNIGNDSNDVVKDLTMKFTRVFDPDLTEQQIAEYWTEHMSSETGTTEYNNIEYYSQKKIYTDKIEIIEITGKLYND